MVDLMKMSGHGVKVGELCVIASGIGKYVTDVEHFTQPCDCENSEPYLPSGSIEVPMQPFGTCIHCMREVVNERL